MDDVQYFNKEVLEIETNVNDYIDSMISYGEYCFKNLSYRKRLAIVSYVLDTLSKDSISREYICDKLNLCSSSLDPLFMCGLTKILKKMEE